MCLQIGTALLEQTAEFIYSSIIVINCALPQQGGFPSLPMAPD